MLSTGVDPGSPAYRDNRAAMLEQLAALEAEQAVARGGGGERYVQRHRDRGGLLPRERIELLIDPGGPFLELSSLAAWGTEFTNGASLVTGVGVVAGVECMLVANDPTVRGGTSNAYTWRKVRRAMAIAASTGSRS